MANGKPVDFFSSYIWFMPTQKPVDFFFSLQKDKNNPKKVVRAYKSQISKLDNGEARIPPECTALALALSLGCAAVNRRNFTILSSNYRIILTM